MKKQIGVIGGGAAGMMAAITAAKEGAQVTILERNDRVGKKILQTGNGKCNLGNRALSVECYHGGDLEWIRDVLEHFDTEDTIRFFQSIGLMVKEKNGYLYPVCEQAAAVLDVLQLGITGTRCGDTVSVQDHKGRKAGLRKAAGQWRRKDMAVRCGDCDLWWKSRTGYRIGRQWI